MTNSDPRKIWRDHIKNNDNASKPLTLGLAGSFTLDPLTPYLGAALINKGVCNPNPIIGPYNQIHQLCFNPNSFFETEPDIIIILWRIEDIVLGDFDKASNEVDQLIASLASLRKNFGGTIIVSNPPYPNLPSFNVHDLQQPQIGNALHHTLSQKFATDIQNIDGIKIFNLHGLLCEEGFKSAHDPRKYYLYKQPYKEDFWNQIGNQLSRLVTAQTQAAKKCIVLDCDNTLWGGIIGEDGLSGIEIGDDFPGSAFRDFQKYLLHLRSKGLFLAIASKNNEEDVFEVFDTHDAMALKRHHISVFEVHWKSKVESLQNIATALNIHTDALVFVDDNPKEIAEVEERLPEVTSLIVPEEPAYLPALLSKTELFDIAEITDEDKKRADMMLAESKRKATSTQMSEEDFLKSLELKIDVFEAEEKHLGRITQLINKTNQFNLTTIRRNQDELENLAKSNTSHIFAMDIRDRFGEYGLVGVAIITQEIQNSWFLDTLLMSCRVLGRSAETSFIAKIAEAAIHYGGNQLIGEYRPTKKNHLVKDLYTNHHFQKDGDKWLLDIDQVRQPPDYVDVTLTLLE